MSVKHLSLGSAIIDGWSLEVESIREDDGTLKHYHTAVHFDSGDRKMIDWSPYAGISNIDFKRLVLLRFPTRAQTGSKGPLSTEQLAELWDACTDDAPGGWRRVFATWPTRLLDGSMAFFEYYWRRTSAWEGVQRVRRRQDTWEHDQLLHPVVKALLDEPINSFTPPSSGAKSN